MMENCYVSVGEGNYSTVRGRGGNEWHIVFLVIMLKENYISIGKYINPCCYRGVLFIYNSAGVG